MTTTRWGALLLLLLLLLLLDRNTTKGNLSFRRSFQQLQDRLEPVVVGVIYICGWSAILFVIAIFVFVFKESLPAITGIGTEIAAGEI